MPYEKTNNKLPRGKWYNNIFQKVINDLLAEKGLYFIKVHHRYDEMMMVIIYFEKIKFSQQYEKSFHLLAGENNCNKHIVYTELMMENSVQVMRWLTMKWNCCWKVKEKEVKHKWIWVEKFYEKFCKMNFLNNFHTFL